MRDFIEDAAKHMDDGYGRAQKHVKQQLPKRFYKSVDVGTVGDDFAVTLDGKTPRTPGQKPVVVPALDLATAMAAEWAAQEEFINPETMPLVRLVNTAVEAGEEQVPVLRDEIVKYAGNDLLLYRADSPRELVADQERLWDDALVRVARHFGVSFQPTIGIIHQPQPDTTLAQLAEVVADESLLPAHGGPGVDDRADWLGAALTGAAPQPARCGTGLGRRPRGRGSQHPAVGRSHRGR